MDEFSENFQTAFNPPPLPLFHFWLQFLQKKVKRSKICNIKVWIEHDPPPPLELFWKFNHFGGVIYPYHDNLCPHGHAPCVHAVSPRYLHQPKKAGTRRSVKWNLSRIPWSEGPNLFFCNWRGKKIPLFNAAHCYDSQWMEFSRVCFARADSFSRAQFAPKSVR